MKESSLKELRKKRAQEVREKLLHHNITGYEIENNTQLSSTTIHNLFNNSGVPNDTTLTIIEKYISENYEANKVSEANNQYGMQEKILHAIELLVEKIDKIDLKYQILFEIIKNKSEKPSREAKNS